MAASSFLDPRDYLAGELPSRLRDTAGQAQK
jgi:hypothetical protein